MNSLWAGAGVAQQLAIAVSSTWSTVHFALRARTGRRPRRLAAACLALLFAAIAVEALADVSLGATAVDVLRRTPLLVATVSIAFLVGYRPRLRRASDAAARCSGGDR